MAPPAKFVHSGLSDGESSKPPQLLLLKFASLAVGDGAAHSTPDGEPRSAVVRLRLALATSVFFGVWRLHGICVGSCNSLSSVQFSPEFNCCEGDGAGRAHNTPVGDPTSPDVRAMANAFGSAHFAGDGIACMGGILTCESFLAMGPFMTFSFVMLRAGDSAASCCCCGSRFGDFFCDFCGELLGDFAETEPVMPREALGDSGGSSPSCTGEQYELVRDPMDDVLGNPCTLGLFPVRSALVTGASGERDEVFFSPFFYIVANTYQNPPRLLCAPVYDMQLNARTWSLRHTVTSSSLAVRSILFAS